MFFDLCAKINPQKPFSQKEIVKSSIEDGYSCVAFNYDHSGALGPQQTCPFKKVDVLSLITQDLNLQAKPEKRRSYEKFKQLSRITLTVNETRHLSQISESNAIINSYDIIAVRTTNQKIFQSLCLETEVVDIISFDLSEKLPFHLKRGQVTEAIKKGIMFEISYSQAVEDMTMRRLIFSNAIQIVRATKGKNIIFSSGAEDAFFHRSPYDAINLASVLELSKDIAFKTVSDYPGKCVQRAEFRKNYKGTISFATTEEEKILAEKEQTVLGQKKLKMEKDNLKKKMIEEESKIEEGQENIKIDSANPDKMVEEISAGNLENKGTIISENQPQDDKMIIENEN